MRLTISDHPPAWASDDLVMLGYDDFDAHGFIAADLFFAVHYVQDEELHDRGHGRVGYSTVWDADATLTGVRIGKIWLDRAAAVAAFGETDVNSCEEWASERAPRDAA